MSLTSYRAAPPRGKAATLLTGGLNLGKETGAAKGRSGRHRELTGSGSDLLGRPGGDLLSRALRRSTIGPEELNDRVRDGIGWGLLGITTRSTKKINFEKTSLSDEQSSHEYY